MDSEAIRAIVRRALDEDLPDVTSNAIFDAEERAGARIIARQAGIIAGLAFAEATFRELDSTTEFLTIRSDGDAVAPDEPVVEIRGRVRALLAAERTALNLLQRASGIATATKRYVDSIAGTGAIICDTRKTAPGLRALDKAAVRAGGGHNHRLGLFDMVLIKNNHVDRAGGVGNAIARARRSAASVPLMVEVRDLPELREAISATPDFILLDNMSASQLREAVAIARSTSPRHIPLEASGGITLQNVREIAETGVDRISIGALTHSVAALDLSMRIEALPPGDPGARK